MPSAVKADLLQEEEGLEGMGQQEGGMEEEAAMEAMEEEEEEAAGQPAQPSSARGAVLGAAEAVGSMLRNVLTGGRAQVTGMAAV